ncbi:MAG: hypothetical protein ACAF41_27660 [Leptolyngbya sp. BL-A-14]
METMRQSTTLRLSAGAMAVAIAAMGISIPAFGADPSPTPSPTPAAQPAPSARSSLIGQCRAVNKRVPVYKQAAATGTVVSTLNAETKVTLADNGSGGFIGISSPVSGYLQTANLKPCSGPTPTPTPTPTGSTCRRVAQPLGLAIRKDATPDSATVGGVANLERVDLTTSPATVKKGPDGRNWVQIAKPTAGWVSNGFSGGNSNLVLCP